MKRIFVFLLAVTAIGVSWFGIQNAQSETPDQLEAAEELQNKEALRSQGKCSDKDILIEVAGTVMSVPRYGATIHMSSGNAVEDLHYAYKCDVKKLVNVQSVNFTYFGIADISHSLDYKTTYDRYVDDIKKARVEESVKILKNGIQEIKKGEMTLYILPVEAVPTANKQPVVLSCSGFSCDTNFRHTKNLSYGYMFFQKDNPPNRFIEIHQEHLNILRTMISGGE